MEERPQKIKQGPKPTRLRTAGHQQSQAHITSIYNEICDLKKVAESTKERSGNPAQMTASPWENCCAKKPTQLLSTHVTCMVWQMYMMASDSYKEMA